jgi:hypothetical protein
VRFSLGSKKQNLSFGRKFVFENSLRWVIMKMKLQLLQNAAMDFHAEREDSTWITGMT